MPLTTRTNGSLSSNIITSDWFNDFLKLLTGVMQDQEVTIKNVLILQAIGGAPSSAASGSAVTGTGLGIGLYVYGYTYANADSETTISPTNSVTTTSGNQKVNLSSITVGPTGTTQRNIYRTAVGGGTSYKFVGSISNNTATTFTDTTPDASLGAAPPSSPGLGGVLIIKDQAGVVKFRIMNDGSFSAGGSTGFGNTTINGTLTVTGATSLDNGLLTTSGFGRLLFNANTPSIDTSINASFLQFRYNNVNIFQVTSTGINCNAGMGVSVATPGITWNGGSLTTKGISTFTGTGTGTYNHNLNGTPVWVAAIANVAGSFTQGFDSVTSTQVHITCGAALAFTALAYRS